MNTSTQLLTKKTQDILSLVDEPKTKKALLAQNEAFIAFLQVQKQLQDEIDSAWDKVRNLMEENKITKIDGKDYGDWGWIGFVPYTTLLDDGSTAPRFLKRTLDTKQVRAYEQLKGTLPKGVLVKSTTRFQKHIK